MTQYILTVNVYKKENDEDRFINMLSYFYLGDDIPNTITNFKEEDTSKVYSKEEIINIVRKLNLPEILAYLKLLHPVQITNYHFEYVVSEGLKQNE